MPPLWGQHTLCTYIFLKYWFVTEHRAELPVLYSRFPLAIYFRHDRGGEGGREVQEGGNIGIHTADSLHCTAETNTTL